MVWNKLFSRRMTDEEKEVYGKETMNLFGMVLYQK
jgi:hypothetical protein